VFRKGLSKEYKSLVTTLLAQEPS